MPIALVKAIQKNRTRGIYMKFSAELAHELQRPRSPWSALCKLENQESWWCNSVWVWRPENLRIDGVSLSPKAWESGVWLCKSWSEPEDLRTMSTDVWGQEKMDVPGSSKGSKFTLPLPFCSIQALSELVDALLHWERLFSLLSLWIQMLISSSRNTHPDRPRNNVLSALQAALSPVKLTHCYFLYPELQPWLCNHWIRWEKRNLRACGEKRKKYSSTTMGRIT